MLACNTIWTKLPLNLLKSRVLQQSNNRSWTKEIGNSVRNYKVSVVGACGGIGQPLSMLLKLNPLIQELVLYDIASTKGLATDLSHICTNTQIDYYEGKGRKSMIEALEDSNIVVVPAGFPRKPNMTRDNLLDANGKIAINVASAIGEACPEALIACITNPINSVVPMMAEVLKSKGKYDPIRLFGVTTLDVVRAKTFLGDFMNIDPRLVNIPVIGGHAGKTILPLISQCKPEFKGELLDFQKLTLRIQEAGTEVVNAKAGTGSATLSMAYAAAHFVNSLLRGLNNESDIVECAYVQSNVTSLPFFANPLELGPMGIKKNLGIPSMNEVEKKAFDALLTELGKSIENGMNFAAETLKAEEANSKHAQKN